MKTYALIDNHSGFLWGVTDAVDAISACKQIDSEISPGWNFDYWETYSGGNWVYAVYQVDKGRYEDADGQDQGIIDEITADTPAAYVGRDEIDETR